MSNMLFYRGRGADSDEAIAASLYKCTPILKQNPSLLIELLDVNHRGAYWEAHIRLMALAQSDGGVATQVKKEEPPENDLLLRSPDSFKLGISSIGAIDDNARASGKFDAAAYGRNIPDIPLQDIEFFGKSGWTEAEMRIHAESNVHVPLLDESDDPKLTYG